MVNRIDKISILRKEVINNVPSFDDPNELMPQSNRWYKTYDIDCVDYAYSTTVRDYDLEHDQNYTNQANRQNAAFYFEATRPMSYDIQCGDYVAFYQGNTLFMWRIVKINQAKVIGDCSSFELVCNMTQPKEANINLETGPLRAVIIGNDGNTMMAEEKI